MAGRRWERLAAAEPLWPPSSPQALVAEQESKDSGGAAVAEQVLSIMEIILDESNAEPLSEDKVCACVGGRRGRPLTGAVLEEVGTQLGPSGCGGAVHLSCSRPARLP